MTYSGEDSRPAIPAGIKRRVLVEAGHRCAIPACRHIDVDIHHIVPWSQRQAHEYDNLIALCPNCHRRADSGEIDRKSLRLYKFNLRFAHDKFSQLEMDVLFQLGRLPPRSAMQWPEFNELLLKRLVDAGYIAFQKLDGEVLALGMSLKPNLMMITPKGQAFLKDIATEDIT